MSGADSAREGDGPSTLWSRSTRVAAAARGVVGWSWIAAYTFAVLVAELLGDRSGALVGTLAEIVLLLVLLGHAGLTAPSPSFGAVNEDLEDRRDLSRALGVLALLPLLRILSWTIPIPQLNVTVWYGAVGVPVLVSIGSAAYALRMSPGTWGLQLGERRWAQIVIPVAGIVFGYLGFILFQPAALVAKHNLKFAVASGIVLFLCSGVAEELLFRGLLQAVLTELLGEAGLLVSTGLFGVMLLGSGSPGFITYMIAVGLLFSLAVRVTRSVIGVSIARGLMTAGMLVLFPLVLR